LCISEELKWWRMHSALYVMLRAGGWEERERPSRDTPGQATSPPALRVYVWTKYLKVQQLCVGR